MPNLKPIRRAQLISQFGVGALVDFRGDESWMTAGLDHWPNSTDDCPSDWLVEDERLQARLKVTHFRLPPEYREPGQNIQHARQYIPFVRFPRWHYCPRRGAMERLTLFNSRRRCPCRLGLDCHSIPEGRRPWLIPSRFIAVCPKGHIEDFPFMKWVHTGEHCDSTHKLRLLASRSSANLSGIKVKCSCGREKSLAGSFNFDATKGGALHNIGYNCSGGMPWLGIEGKQDQCGDNLRVVQRGASNIFFPLTVSSIYLPLWGEECSSTINNIIDNPNIWDVLTANLDKGKYIQLVLCKGIAASYDVDPMELKKAAQRKLDGHSIKRSTIYRSDEELRYQEFEALRSGRGGKTTDLLIEKRSSAEYGPNLAKLLKSVCLVKKLRETRVFMGFSRLLPIDDATSADLLPISVNVDLKWLPATVVFGEGIFFEFKTEEIERWLDNQKVKDRVDELQEGYNQYRLERGLSEIDITAKFVFLHTFAHILIGQLSFDCGYGSASLRERIYCEQNDSNQKMQGVLIYTASGDSEGTLGGLVRQGDPNRMSGVIIRAILRARWCSSDPVCIESFGQGNENANRAACHNCALLPETSCEKGNRFLDRGLIVGTTSNPEIGLFSDFNPT